MASQTAIGVRNHLQAPPNNGIDITPSNVIRSTLGAVEMAALEGKLQLLQIQRELSAVRCQGFIEMIQSSLLAEQKEAAAKSAVKSAVKSGARSSGDGDADGGAGADPRLTRNSIEPLDRSRRQSRQLFRHMSLDVHPTAGNQTWREDLSFYDEPTSCSPRVQGHGGNAASHGSPSQLRGSPRHRSPRHAAAARAAQAGGSASPRTLPQTSALLRPGSPLVTAPGARQLPLTPRTASAASPRVVVLANSPLRRHVSLSAGFESPCQ